MPKLGPSETSYATFPGARCGGILRDVETKVGQDSSRHHGAQVNPLQETVEGQRSKMGLKCVGV